MANVVYAIFSTWVTPTVQVEKGQIWDPEDPVVKSHPDWFTDDPSAFVRRSQMYSAASANAAGPEAATAAPGEKRSVPKVDATFDEAASLREELTTKGVKVDKRWSLERLRQEAAKA